MAIDHPEPEKLAAAIRDIAITSGSANEDITLVGGQSVLFWAEAYNIQVPQNIAILTEDVDFVANKTDILDVEEALSARFSCKLIIADMDQSSPNSGKMSVEYPGVGKINIDFLRMITGVDPGEVSKNAFPFDLGDGSVIHIISPILLLRSKISNIGAHLNKRNEEGIAQAKLAIEIAKKYLEDRILNGSKPPYQEFEEVIRFSRCDAALYANKFHGLDPMAAIPLEAIPADDPFLVKRYPVAMEQLKIKRQKFDTLIQRMDACNKNSKSGRYQP